MEIKDKLFKLYNTNDNGLSKEEVENRIIKYGKNILPEEKQENIIITFLKQYMDPMTYILLFASLVSCFLKEYTDSIFILAVVSINAIIGTAQEYSAKKSASSLKQILEIKTTVIRDGNEIEVLSKDLTVGDLVVLKEGNKIPADIILFNSKNLKVDESMLTGESQPVLKDYNYQQKKNSSIQDKLNELFSGTIVLKGQGFGIVKSVGINTEIGKIADKITQKSTVNSPLVERMEGFTTKLTIIMGVTIFIIAFIALYLGTDWRETLMMSASLGVAAIPEGLPIGITIALAIGMNRMAKNNVIVKNLNAVESLGSCTVIASDKTGTLTKNELSIIEIITKENKLISTIETTKLSENFNNMSDEEKTMLSFILPNEASEKNNEFFGDSVDVAFLKVAKKKGYNIKETHKKYKRLQLIPYTSELKYSASFNLIDNNIHTFIKGAPETIIDMCKIDSKSKKNIEDKLDELTKKGLRILAVATKKLENNKLNDEKNLDKHLKNLEFLALVTMLDPLRDEVKEAVKECQMAGVKVVMITGDNPKTAFAIGSQLNFVKNQNEVVTGLEIKLALEKGEKELDKITKKAKVFARVEPNQKLDIVSSLRRNGNFVAVTGDGVNDAPALKNSNVGIAMGKKGTDIARESANIILTDDNFASIVKGVKEGRITYSNIRNLIFFLTSTSFAEIGVFILSMIFKLPLPFTAIQLLWINIITETIQGVAIVMEGEEGNEMSIPPRDPKEAIFNKIMLIRILLTSFVIIFGCFGAYKYFIEKESLKMARSIVLFLMILFQNIQIFNSRSETKSLFKQGFSKNPFLFISISFVLLLHTVASYVDNFDRFLKINPLSWAEFKIIIPIALTLIIVMESEKLIRKILSNDNKKCI